MAKQESKSSILYVAPAVGSDTQERVMHYLYRSNVKMAVLSLPEDDRPEHDAMEHLRPVFVLDKTILPDEGSARLILHHRTWVYGTGTMIDLYPIRSLHVLATLLTILPMTGVEIFR